MIKFLICAIMMFIFAFQSNASEVQTNNFQEKEVIFSNQKENEKKRDIQTSFNISLNTDDDVELTDYQKALLNCESFNDGNKTIIGFVDDKCKTEEIIDDKKVVCNFEKDDLKIASEFYADKESNILKTIAGNYNFDFKMDIPEVGIDKKDDDTVFNFKMALPKIKLERTKTPSEILIEKSCK